MPGMDGFEVCRMLKKTGNIAISRLTSKDEVDDMLLGGIAVQPRKLPSYLAGFPGIM